jgi:hypothetical protein
MAKVDPINTLSYFNSRVFGQHRDMSSVLCHPTAMAMQKFMVKDKHKDVKPEGEAIRFYGLNHGLSLIRERFDDHQPLPEWECAFAEEYHRTSSEAAIRAFYYLIWICTREARHNKSLDKDKPKIGELFGKPMFDFFSGISGGEQGISKKFLEQPPATSLGVYVKALAWTFYHSKWSSSYGGKKWGVVTDCLVSFVHGETSAEMMMDTVWTLVHNGGPIFNKGAFYDHYDSTLYRLLDVQRAGMIPEAVLTDAAIQSKITPHFVALIGELKTRYPEKLGDYVDWMQVEALGAVQKYPYDIKHQMKTWGQTPEQKAAALAAAQKKIADEAAALTAKLKAQADYEASHFTVMSGLVVPKVKRAA